MEQENLKSILESLLFISNKPITAKDLAKFLEQDETIVKQALAELCQDKKEAGVVVLENGGEYQMATSAKNSTQVKNFLNAELREKLTDATVEVLAIIAYRQPISKAEIEAIRGVNSQYSIRHLLMRGLIEKAPNPSDARGFVYKTSTEFLQHMGLSSLTELPEFEKLVSQIKLPQTPQAEASMEISDQSEPEQNEEPEKPANLIPPAPVINHYGDPSNTLPATTAEANPSTPSEIKKNLTPAELSAPEHHESLPPHPTPPLLEKGDEDEPAVPLPH